MLATLNPKNARTRQALQDFPYCLAVKNKIGGDVLDQAERAGSGSALKSTLMELARRQAESLRQALKSLVKFLGVDPVFRPVVKKMSTGYEFFFICPFKIKKLRYRFVGCKELASP